MKFSDIGSTNGFVQRPSGCVRSGTLSLLTVIAMAPAQDVVATLKSMLLRVSFAHLQRSLVGILTAQLGFVNEVKGASALFDGRHQYVRYRADVRVRTSRSTSRCWF